MEPTYLCRNVHAMFQRTTQTLLYLVIVVFVYNPHTWVLISLEQALIIYNLFLVCPHQRYILVQ